MNWVKVAAVLTSTFFLVASCTGITLLSIPVLKHTGSKYMARGEAPSTHMVVIASVPVPTASELQELEAVILVNLSEFESAHPGYTFVIPPGHGTIDNPGMSTSFRATSLGAGRVRVDTDTLYDVPGGLYVVGTYEASPRGVELTCTNETLFVVAAWFGLAGMCSLGLAGYVMRWAQRRRQQRDL